MCFYKYAMIYTNSVFSIQLKKTKRGMIDKQFSESLIQMYFLKDE